MIFAELEIGDWFTDIDGGYVENCIFMKNADDNAVALNWHQCTNNYFSANTEIRFCPSFSVALQDTDELSSSIVRKPFEVKENAWNLVHYFNEIPLYAIYKGKGQTYYKKITDTSSVVFWSPKPTTMGKCFEREESDISTHYGTYYICVSGNFNFPEDKCDFPIPTTGV